MAYERGSGNNEGDGGRSWPGSCAAGSDGDSDANPATDDDSDDGTESVILAW